MEVTNKCRAFSCFSMDKFDILKIQFPPKTVYYELKVILNKTSKYTSWNFKINLKFV